MKQVCIILNYIELFHFLASTFTKCVTTTSSAIGFKVWTIAGGIKKCESIIKKKKMEHNKTVLLAKVS